MTKRLPSPAFVLALIALFVAMGGVGYSAVANSIGSRAIKNNAIRSADVRNDALTGADIRESSLGTVPRAVAADTADTAARAQTAGAAASVNGLRLVPIKHRSGNVAGATILDAGGVELLVSCNGGDESVVARTSVAGGEITVLSDDAASDNGDANLIARNLDFDFKPGDTFDVRGTPTAADDRIYELHYLGGDGTDLTAHLTTQHDLGADNCIVSGYAVIG